MGSSLESGFFGVNLKHVFMGQPVALFCRLVLLNGLVRADIVWTHLYSPGSSIHREQSKVWVLGLTCFWAGLHSESVSAIIALK
jgi:hypothetical protein